MVAMAVTVLRHPFPVLLSLTLAAAVGQIGVRPQTQVLAVLVVVAQEDLERLVRLVLPTQAVVEAAAVTMLQTLFMAAAQAAPAL